jgi:channel protein (hemolysin III family)
VADIVPILGFAEPAASWLHLVGAAVALASIPSLYRSAHSVAARRALLVFGAGVVLALAVSGVFHIFDLGGTARAVLQRLDHAAIWVLIACTFTPVHLILLRGIWRWGVLSLVWACALAGIVLKTIFFAGFPESLGLLLYLCLGWVGALSAMMVARRHGFRTVRLLLLGGLIYSIGGVIYALDWPNPWPGYLGHHEMFHLAVLAGLASHWRSMQSFGELETRAAAAADLPRARRRHQRPKASPAAQRPANHSPAAL